ncbi:hypothetical protein NSK_005799 [Nannochloropsis salina CCMP1776]|uniref:Uncharacterized protein n=1 Tax=Nannochloropsis salina CCMP1776 TaxID=1027361 RepID=A0A4D9CZ52_9STRA|nr:hypothetical protein NSK_005799 [Nannochloropsis salina CCMP1776]|eukprot:TFJ82883.1 hypothetical protein NSK_005799 [Nannochloropsis salina CCMP1776]
MLVHVQSLRCATFGAATLEERKLATGDWNGALCVWDLDHLDSGPCLSLPGHSGVVNAIDGVGGLGKNGHGAPELVTGAKDGNASNDSERVVAAGYDNGDVKLFDLRTNSIRHEDNVGNGVTSLEFDRWDTPMNKLVITTLESSFHLWRLRGRDQSETMEGRVVGTEDKPEGGVVSSIKQKTHHNATVWSVRHLPQNRDVLVTCGGEGGLALWQ